MASSPEHHTWTMKRHIKQLIQSNGKSCIGPGKTCTARHQENRGEKDRGEYACVSSKSPADSLHLAYEYTDTPGGSLRPKYRPDVMIGRIYTKDNPNLDACRNTTRFFETKISSRCHDWMYLYQRQS
jgi:hypothetical protein